MSGPRVKLTYEDYLQMPEEQRYELLEGDLRMVPAPGFNVILNDDSVVQPDLVVILNATPTATAASNGACTAVTA